MGYATSFEKASPLDSLSWVTMEHSVLVARLAARFLREEKELKERKEKGDWFVTRGIIKPWLLSLFEPPRGTVVSLIDDVFNEITRQREIRDNRRKNRPWKWPESDILARRNLVSMGLYGILRKPRKEEPTVRIKNECKGISTVAGVRLALDATYDAHVRLYMRHLETGAVKVIVTDIHKDGFTIDWTITKLLLKLAPSAVERGLFGGQRITLNYVYNGFDVEGVFYPFLHVAKVYEGHERVMRTWFKVKVPEAKSSVMDEDE